MTYTSVMIILGVLAALAWTLISYKKRTGSITEVLALFLLGFVLSFLFCRFLHWVSAAQTYSSLGQAFKDLSIGSYAFQGAVIGAGLAAAVLGLLKVDKDLLMDCAAPGFCLLTALVRLGSWGTGKCQGSRNIEAAFLHFFPICVKGKTAAGTVYYRFASFAVEALLMLLAFLLVRELYGKYAKRSRGHIWDIMLAIWAAIEIVLDSTRVDSMHFTFRKILTLNRFSTFISIGQVVPAVIFVVLLIKYIKRTSEEEGFGIAQIASIVLCVAGLFLVGYLGEYKWQREGFFISYLWMTVGALLALVSVGIVWRKSLK